MDFPKAPDKAISDELRVKLKRENGEKIGKDITNAKMIQINV